jgi:dephospho-CoA kinase
MKMNDKNGNAGDILLIGLTGNVGSGKSTVARLWCEERGATVIDADHLGAEAVKPGGRALEKLVERFGERILRADGSLDRRLMGKIAFSNTEDLDALNKIVHPEIILQIKTAIEQARNRGEPVVAVDAALIYEFGIDDIMDRVVLVDAPLEVRKQRMLAKNKMDKQTLERLMSFQMDAEEMKGRAHHLIENNSDLETLRGRALEVFDRLTDLNKTK